MNKKIISAVTAAAIVFSFVGCGKKETSEKSESAATSVTVSEAAEESIENTVSYTGEVKASSSASIAPKASGTVKTVNAEIGDYVSAGTVLMTIDSTSYQLSYNQAQAAYNSAVAAYNNIKNGSNAQTEVSLNQSLATAQSAYDTALDNYNRQKSLYDIGAVSKVTLDNAQTQLDNAKIALDAAKESAKLNSSVIAPQSEASAKAAAEQAKAAVDLAADSLANCTVRAPISGYIATRSVNVGQLASQGVEAFSIKDSDAVDVEINVTESVIGSINVGTKAKIDIKSASLEDIEGTVSVAGETKNDSTGMFVVKVTIPNSDGKIKVGMLADVSLVTGSVENAVVIPLSSVMQENDEYYVYIADGDKAVKRTITVGISNSEKMQVLSGLSVGEKVIVDGKEYISDKNNDINIVTD